MRKAKGFVYDMPLKVIYDGLINLINYNLIQ